MKKLALILASALLSACGDSSIVDSDNGDFYYEDEENCNCGAMYEEPTKANVTFRVTINDENPNVGIDVYKGSMTDGVKIKSYTTSEKRIQDSLPFDTYTYVASYKKDDKTIIVPVNAKLDFSENECNGYECYQILNNVIDLSLRY